MNKTKIFIGIALVSSVALIGVFIHNQLKIAARYCFKQYKTVVKKITLRELIIDTIFLVKNPSELEATLKGFTIDVYINDKKASQVVSNVQRKVPPSGTFPIEMRILANPEKIFGSGIASDLLNDFGADSKVLIRFSGKLNLRFGLLTVKNFPFEFSDTLGNLLSSKPKEDYCKDF